MRSDTRQNAHLTHKANAAAGRHGWLRLTPAYSVRLVRAYAAELPAGAVVTDPFSGTGTTPLAAAEFGHTGQALDVNPFLVWLGTAKAAAYDPGVLEDTGRRLTAVLAAARELLPAEGLWQPELHNIERWWARSALDALKAVRRALDTAGLPPGGRDLLDIAFCRTLIAASTAAFNHQSMSFKAAGAAARHYDADEAGLVVGSFRREAGAVLTAAAEQLAGAARVLPGDSRDMRPAAGELAPCDLLLTSPPYVNRMSYIRELRPYMYWLRHLRRGGDAGELDWRAIGGTWGTATSRVRAWEPPAEPIPVSAELARVRAAIRADGGRNGPVLGNYVVKYFHDMWAHFQAAYRHVRCGGGRAVYVIGNSTFYGNEVPAQEWYATLLRETGFTRVRVEVIRKRNSNKALFEYAVSGVKP